MPGKLLEHVLEHRGDVEIGVGLEGAELLRLLLGGADLGVEAVELGLVALVVPFAERDEMLLQPRDRIAERPRRAGILGAVDARGRRRWNGLRPGR